MKKSAKMNFIYNVFYEILVIILPLITAPYISRVIGANGLGIYSYTHSIVYYFSLLTLLGVKNYGNRAIAKVRDDKEKLSKTFWSIYYFQIVMGFIMLGIYLTYVIIFDKNYTTISLIQSLFIISAILDINWLFFGLEEFKITVTRNSIIKILTLIMIFLFIKCSQDLWKYTLIMASMTMLSQLVLWSFLKKQVKICKVSFREITRHIKPNIILFIPIIAISIYKTMDKIMLGAMTTVDEVGFYENAEKTINIPLTIRTALGTVMLPKISNLVAKGEKEKIEKYISKSIKFVMFLSFAMCAGLISIGYDFSTLFFGEEFQKTGELTILLAFTLPFISFANVLRTQYLIPNERDKDYIISVIIGAVINLIFNLIFIPNFLSCGACIGTIAAEFVVMFYQMYILRKNLPIRNYLWNLIPFGIKAIIMFIIVYSINFIYINSVFMKIIIQIFVGIIVYCILNYKYIKSNIDINKIFSKFRDKKKYDNI